MLPYGNTHIHLCDLFCDWRNLGFCRDQSPDDEVIVEVATIFWMQSVSQVLSLEHFATDCPGMTLRLTSAPVSGVKKRKSIPKPRSSPFAAHARRKPSSAATAAVQAAEELIDDDPLPDIGGSRFISETAEVQNVVQAIQAIRTRMFDELPQRAGMNSTRIAEVLNLRRSLPPLASVAHVHTLLNAPTQVEREIVELVQSGRVRRLIVPGRGSDAAGLGDCLVLAEDWEDMVRGSTVLDDDLKGKYSISDSILWRHRS
jgi:hypothetical protein